MEELMQSEYEVNRTGGDGKGTGRVKAPDIALLQERLFDTLVYFADFCDEHGINYILAGGTCIGAAREGDFIPWDDDLDVAVLRKDFDKLFDQWEKYGDKENYSLYRTNEDFCAYTPIGVLRNNNTTFIRSFEENCDDRIMGVKIDIEPLDEIPENPVKRKIQLANAYLYVLFLTQRRAMREKKLRKIGTAVILGVIRRKKTRNRILRLVEKQVVKYNGTGCKRVAINGLGYSGPITDYSETRKMMFHGKEFKVPADYDSYLRRMYGDYQTRPEAKDRVPADKPSYYDLNTPYKEYKRNKKSF